jgi:hypothetical protein
VEKFLRIVLAVIMVLSAFGFAQQGSSPAPATPQPSQSSAAGQKQTGESATSQSSTSASQSKNPQLPNAPSATDANQQVPASKRQPKRILGVMPNYRAVSAGALPPPPSPKEAFKIATEQSFDYSAFIFVGLTSLLAEGTDTHPQLGKGIGGFGQYYWRGFLDKAGGNYLVLWALPTVLHEDERYYALGNGSILKRGIYAASRILITPNYQGKNTFNASDVFGRGIAEGISAAYYPAAERSVGEIAVKYGWAMGRDALTNVVREFWPDISTKLLHRHP